MAYRRQDPWKGLLLGAIGGAVGTLAMGYYWQAVTALRGSDPRMETVAGEHALDQIALAGQQHQPEESSTAAVGRIGYHAMTGAEPQAPETKTTLSYTVHYAYGALQGAVYGGLRGAAEAPDISGGVAFGSALWLFGDELAVSLLGLAEGPTQYPLSQHIHRFGAHLAYGMAAAGVTQLLRRVL